MCCAVFLARLLKNNEKLQAECDKASGALADARQAAAAEQERLNRALQVGGWVGEAQQGLAGGGGAVGGGEGGLCSYESMARGMGVGLQPGVSVLG